MRYRELIEKEKIGQNLAKDDWQKCVLGYAGMQENRKKKEDICMQKNDTVVVEITDIGVNGEGIGKIDGYTAVHKRRCNRRCCRS